MVHVPLSLAVYCGSDVTQWVESVTVSNAPGVYFRQAQIVFRGWVPQAADLDARWSIYMNGELMLRDGICPPDGWDSGRVSATEVGTVTCTVYDWAWIAQRVTSRSTWVVGRKLSDCVKLVKAGVLGRDQYASGAMTSRTWSPHSQPSTTTSYSRLMTSAGSAYHPGRWTAVLVYSMHDLVTVLAKRAGMGVEIRIPNYALQPFILDPTTTFWGHIKDLTSCFYPDYYFLRDKNRLIIADSLSDAVGGVGSKIGLTKESITAVGIRSERLKWLQRVIVNVPEWNPDDNAGEDLPGTLSESRS